RRQRPWRPAGAHGRWPGARDHQRRSECATMLRVVIILLVLANAVYFAWTGGHLAALGLAPTDQTEPQRLRDQVNPDMVRLLNSAQPVAPAASQPPSPPSTPAPETTPPADNAAAAVEPPPSAPEPAVAAPAAP